MYALHRRAQVFLEGDAERKMKINFVNVKQYLARGALHMYFIRTQEGKHILNTLKVLIHL